MLPNPDLKYPLLTIAILVSCSISAQFLTGEEIEELQSNSKVISQSPDFSKADWISISEYVKDKKIVSIGEFTHGAHEIFEMQNSLIEFLVTKEGFEVILFESGMGELIDLNIRKTELSPAELTAGFFGGWRNQSRRELMQFIREYDIEFAGFDPQRFGISFYQTLKQETNRLGLDSAASWGLEHRFSLVSRQFRNAVYDSIAPVTNALIADWQLLYSAMEDGNIHPIVLKGVQNRISYLQYYLQFTKDKDWDTRFAARDSIMADNTIWLIENLYPDRKVIVLTHNYHASRYNDKILTMGQVLNSRYGDEMFVLGSFALDGEYAGNSGDSKPMDPPDTTQLDLKHVMMELDGFCQFVRADSGTSVFNRQIVVNDTFLDLNQSNKLVLSRHFDGLIFVKKVSPPKR